jgi:HK97 family phage major capsid protein
MRGFNGEIRKTALAENAGQTGGYVIPPQFMSELLTIAAEEGFVEQMCRINKGRAFYTTPDTLGDYVLVDFLEHRRTTRRAS